MRDYQALTTTPLGGSAQKLDAPAADMVMLDLAEPGNFFAVRPSGTEPKVKFYTFAASGPCTLAEVPTRKQALRDRLALLEKDIRQYVASCLIWSAVAELPLSNPLTSSPPMIHFLLPKHRPPSPLRTRRGEGVGG